MLTIVHPNHYHHDDFTLHRPELCDQSSCTALTIQFNNLSRAACYSDFLSIIYLFISMITFRSTRYRYYEEMVKISTLTKVRPIENNSSFGNMCGPLILSFISPQRFLMRLSRPDFEPLCAVHARPALIRKLGAYGCVLSQDYAGLTRFTKSFDNRRETSHFIGRSLSKNVRSKTPA